jgi:hypothetical protein
MSIDDIIRIARECGNWSGQTVEMNDVGLERFANLVVAAEREACAQVCDLAIEANSYQGSYWTISGCAKAIRARGEK